MSILTLISLDAVFMVPVVAHTTSVHVAGTSATMLACSHAIQQVSRVSNYRTICGYICLRCYQGCRLLPFAVVRISVIPDMVVHFTIYGNFGPCHPIVTHGDKCLSHLPRRICEVGSGLLIRIPPEPESRPKHHTSKSIKVDKISVRLLHMGSPQYAKYGYTE